MKKKITKKYIFLLPLITHLLMVFVTTEFNLKDFFWLLSPGSGNFFGYNHYLTPIYLFLAMLLGAYIDKKKEGKK